MINCVIIDDEQHAIDILVHYTGQIPFLNLVLATTNSIEALQLIDEGKIDLVFLDIQMPALSGIDFIKATAGKTMIILTTAYSEYAIEGYELDVVDYLLKPIRFPRFLAAVQKVVKLMKDQPAENPSAEKAQDYIFVKTESKGKLIKINFLDIEFIEGMKNYVAIHCNGKKILVYTNMKDIETKLPHNEFIRVHKSFIIPISKITGIEGNKLRLNDVNADIVIGESYKNDLMEIIKNRMIQ